MTSTVVSIGGRDRSMVAVVMGRLTFRRGAVAFNE